MLELYTDGACSPNPGTGGWAAIFISDGKVVGEVFGYVEDTTNNRMELLSAINGLKACKDFNDITIYSDSQYLVNTMTKGWQKSKNIDLWVELDKAINNRHIEWIWVKGHASNPYNAKCDQLAVMARTEKINQFEV